MKSIIQIALVSLLATILLPANAEAQRSGVEIWAQTCGNCHSIQPPDRYTAEKWAPIMSHMKLTARLTDAEAEAVLQFLQSGAKRTASVESADQPVWSLIGATRNPNFSSRSEALDAAEDFRLFCSACHGSSGEGDGPAAVAFNPRPRDFTNPEFQRSFTDEALANVIRDGKSGTGMAAFGSQLSARQIRGLVDYIRSFAN